MGLIEISESRTKNRVRSSRNQIEIEVISYPCRGEAQVVSAFGRARMRQSHHSHLRENCLFRQRRERALWRRSRARRELSADGRHLGQSCEEGGGGGGYC